MSDQGFDFGPAPPKREARQFEPPPWERDQFEQRKREEAEREAAEQAARAKVLAEQEAAEDARGAGAAEHNGAPPVAAQGGLSTAAASADEPEAQSAQGHTPAVDEKKVALMMLDLRAEEPAALEGAWVVNIAAGAVVVLVGSASAIWGAAALARKGMPVAGTLGGFVLLAFGLGFLGVGAWLIYKALRQRGVL